MEPFNIKLEYHQKDVTLTILPEPDQKAYYKVIYFGGILGALYFDREDWVMVQPEDIPAGDLPLYDPDLKGEHLELKFTEYLAEQIGHEIDLYHDQQMI
ncbi:hypothetical protein HDF26_004381 [Pedobacter cryoconitis]|uniref:hypothetical protein n=1 Tax=Pedobacter cryoconitis TaxID=188932 RepID=UPI00160B24D1|nr:hypothetical protein [Pedobacter cryoconitis]MBB6273908.1 hypothetical protein [Pedobacter cryoconitis]